MDRLIEVLGSEELKFINFYIFYSVSCMNSLDFFCSDWVDSCSSDVFDVEGVQPTVQLAHNFGNFGQGLLLICL